MLYRTSVKIPAERFFAVNDYLSLPYFDQMTDKEKNNAGVVEGMNETIFDTSFKDGSRFTYDLCSNWENFYDNMVFIDKDGYEYTIDPDFELGEQIEIEDYETKNTYLIDIIIDWSKCEGVC